MTSEKKSFLLAQLQEAIDQAVSESSRISGIVDEMKRSGFDLCLLLESTVTISPTGDHQPDAVPEPRLAADEEIAVAEINATGEFELTNEDLEFLQEMNIAVGA
jgi:hypothetical protein